MDDDYDGEPTRYPDCNALVAIEAEDEDHAVHIMAEMPSAELLTLARAGARLSSLAWTLHPGEDR